MPEGRLVAVSELEKGDEFVYRDVRYFVVVKTDTLIQSKPVNGYFGWFFYSPEFSKESTRLPRWTEEVAVDA